MKKLTASSRSRLAGSFRAGPVFATALLASYMLYPVIYPFASYAGGGHLASNLKGDFDGAAEIGFDLADVASIAVLDTLPEGMKGVFWLGNGYNTTCSWRLSDEEVVEHVKTLKDNPKFSGIYYIADEPHPSKCSDAAEKVAARTQLIHETDPIAKTFIIVENRSKDPHEFEKLKDAADYIGVAPYPCNIKNAEKGCDYKALKRRIEEALAAGIAPERIVPVFQVFGQACAVTKTPYYRMPSVVELTRMLTIWDEHVPPETRPFDMAYSWGAQEKIACPSLSQADGVTYPALRETFAAYLAGKLIPAEE